MSDVLSPAHSVSQPGHRIVALDGLRGVAALMVLFHHALLMLPDFANEEWQVRGAKAHGTVEWLLLQTPLRLMWSGQTRALLFFVLSGFVLALPWLNGRSAPYGKFLLGRFCRIYPPYLIVMMAAAAGSMALGGHPLGHATLYFNQLGWAFPPSWAAVPSVAAILDNPASSFMNESVWTLVWEARVALIFPLLMLAIIRWGNVGVGLVLVALIVLKHVSGRFVGPWVSSVLDAPQDTFYYAQYFVYGAAVAANRIKIAAWFSDRSEWLGVACLALGCLICWLPWPVQHDRMIGIGAAGVLVSIIGSPQIQSWFTKAPLPWLGAQSYSLYLTHVPLIMVVVIAFNGNLPVLGCCAVIPASIALAWAFHRWIETPAVAFTQRLTGYAARTGHHRRASPIRTTPSSALSTPPHVAFAQPVLRD